MTFPDLPKAWHHRPPPHTSAYRRWLVEPGSLTRRIQATCENFCVELVSQHRRRPFDEESQALDMPVRRSAWVREVFLRCGPRNVVFAHSVVPADSLSSRWRHLRALGTRPLGAALFANPQIRRSAMAYRRLTPQHALYTCAVASEPERPSVLWARRSLFTLDDHPILVTEVFLPAILAL